jgi:hypothetical protein
VSYSISHFLYFIFISIFLPENVCFWIFCALSRCLEFSGTVASDTSALAHTLLIPVAQLVILSAQIFLLFLLFSPCVLDPDIWSLVRQLLEVLLYWLTLS